MAEQTRSAWSAVKGAFYDAVTGFNVYPLMYVGLALIGGAYQFVMGPILRTHEQDLTPDELVLPGLVLLALCLLMVPIFISLMRYFVMGDTSRSFSFARPFLRLIGWVILISLMVMAIFFVFVIVGILLGGVSHALTIASFVIGYVMFIWFALRLFTIYPALALDEPAPILKRSFGETKGWVWFIIRASLASLVIFVPMMILLIGLQFAIIGIDAMVPKLGVPSDVSLAQRLGEAIIMGLYTAFGLSFTTAFMARIFRAIRGFS